MNSVLRKSKFIYGKLITGMAITILSMAALFTAYWYWQEQSSHRLDALLDSLTYQQSSSTKEMLDLMDFKELFLLNDRQNAQYYAALTKLNGLVRGDTNIATENFTNGQIYAKRCNASDISAWLYADYSQIFINMSSWQTAVNCLQQSLKYAESAHMDDSYYAYCYTTLAFAYANMDSKNLHILKKYYEKAESYRGTELYKDFPFDIMLELTQAELNLEEANYTGCRENLSSVKSYLDACREEAKRYLYVSWVVRYALPYSRISTLLALDTQNYDQALESFEEGYHISENYPYTNSIMNYLSDILPAIYTSKKTDSQVLDELFLYAKDAVIRYTGISEEMSASTGESMYQSADSVIVRITEEHRVTQLYKAISFIIFCAGGIFLFLTYSILLVRKRSNIDGLTGAYNRRCFDEASMAYLQKKKNFGMILYDIDHFKDFNDTYGHAFGDEVLRSVTAAVAGQLKHTPAVLYRYGGDEFVILWNKCKLESLVNLAQIISATVSSFTWENGAHVTLSMGVSHSSQSDDPLNLADSNLYAAKEAGRNCIKSSSQTT